METYRCWEGTWDSDKSPYSGWALSWEHARPGWGAEGLDATLLTRFHPDIRRLLAHPALRGIVVPSRAEPFGRVPIDPSR